MIKKVVFIGAGNLATQLSLALKQQGITILQVYSRSEVSAKALGDKIGCTAITELNSVSDNADLYIFSVKDDVLPNILDKFPHKHKAVVHTAGSIPLDVFTGQYTQYGVFYPLQTFSKQKDISFEQIPICIEACTDDMQNKLMRLGKSLSSNVSEVSSEQRRALHLAAVFVCNFANQLYSVGSDILKQDNLPFDLLKPLIQETANKIMHAEPKEVQTGPAVRYDKQVIQKHVNMLEGNSDLQDLYVTMSEMIYKSQNNK